MCGRQSIRPRCENHKKFQSSLVVSRRHGLNSYPRPSRRDQNLEPPPRASNPERRRTREVVRRAEGERHGRTQQYLQLVDCLSGRGEREEQGPPRRGNWRGWRAGGRRSGAVAANRRRAYCTGGHRHGNRSLSR